MNVKRFILMVVPAAFCTVMAAEKSSTQNQWITEECGYRLNAATTAAGAITEIGKPFSITVELSPLKQQTGFFRAELYLNGIKQKDAKLYELGKKAEYNFTADTPGTVTVVCKVLDNNKKSVWKNKARKYPLALGFGVMVSPEKLSPGLTAPPEDIDLFWQQKRAELDKIPVKAQCLNTETHKSFTGVICKDMRVDCIGKAVSGYLCMPENAKPKSLPAVVIFDGAGVRSAMRPWHYGRKAISFAINAHGVDNGCSPQYYKDIYQKEPLKSYRTGTWKNHNSNYFTGMYIRCMRALDYVKSLPEWNGKTLIVRGNSQGGAQALAAAALDPQVTLCQASVPSMCDLGARLANRLPGGPLPSLSVDKQRDPELAREAAYVDNVWLAKRIKASVYLSAGLADHTCHAASIQVLYNALPRNITKDLTLTFTGNHSNSKTPKGNKAAADAITSH